MALIGCSAKALPIPRQQSAAYFLAGDGTLCKVEPDGSVTSVRTLGQSPNIELAGRMEEETGNWPNWLTDKLKHLLTGDRIEVEPKFGHRMSIKSMHRMIMTSNHTDVVEISDDERRFFVCDVSDKRLADYSYFAPLWRVASGEDERTLAAFMHELKTRDITNWRPEQGARNVASLHITGQQMMASPSEQAWRKKLISILPDGAQASDTHEGWQGSS
jgi:uncharacterized protein DUF5906